MNTRVAKRAEGRPKLMVLYLEEGRFQFQLLLSIDVVKASHEVGRPSLADTVAGALCAVVKLAGRLEKTN
jgi:hypothetical protein